MAVKQRTRVTCYPPLDALAIVGGTAPDVNLAVGAFARMIGRATEALDLGEGEWNAIADVLNGCMITSEFPPQQYVALEVSDGDTLNGLGEKWSIDGQALARKISEMDDVSAWAVVFAARFFWSYYQHDLPHDWWRIRHRIAMQESGDKPDLEMMEEFAGRFSSGAGSAESIPRTGAPVRSGRR